MAERMYYYTSTDTMCKILQKGDMFATNLNYMNDAQEYVNGLKEIRTLCLDEELVRKVYSGNTDEMNARMIETLRNEMTEEKLHEYMETNTRYSISFCKDRDLLSQWTTYARESGVSIEMVFDMDRDVCFKFDNAAPDAGETSEIEYFARPREILYLTKGRGDDYEKTGMEVLYRMFPKGYQEEDEGDVDSKLSETWKENSVYIKQYDFYQEKEYRIAFDYMKLNVGSGRPRIDYRTDKHVIKPYLDVKCENGWPIISVMVGPGFNQQVVYRSVKFFLDHAQIQSSGLYSRKQWGEQIERYLNGVLPAMPDEKTPNAEEWRNKRKTLSDICRSLIENADCDEKIEENKQNRLYEMVSELSHTYFNILTGKESELAMPYFSKSGIILECSQIPYIF